MKKNLKYILCLNLLLFITLSSCIKTVDNFKFKEKPAKITINGLINPDSTLTVNISRSLSISSNEPFDLNQNVQANVYLNNVLITELVHIGNGWYISDDFKPEINKNYTIIANSDGYEQASAQFKIPDIPNFEFIKSVVIQRYDTDNCSGTCPSQLYIDVTFSIQDDGYEENYYIIDVIGLRAEEDNNDFFVTDQNSDNSMYVKIIVTTDEHIVDIEKHGSYYWIISQDYVPSASEFFFKDIFFNGDDYPITLSVAKSNLYNINFGESSEKILYFRLRSIEKSYFDYAISMAENTMANNNPLSEPASIYTNVENGLGIVYGYNQMIIEVDVSEIFEEE